MYKIIGANQVEYGPVSADQVRQWISEGRINAQTSCQAAGETTWKPIATFAEFAAHFPLNATPPLLSAPPPPPPPLGAAVPSATGRASALNEVNGPAVGLMVAAILGLGGAVVRVLFDLFGGSLQSFSRMEDFPQNAEVMRLMQSFGGSMDIALAVLQIALAILIFFGALKMKALQNHTFCIVSAIVALVPCISPCCCVGLPIGIWALIVLNKPEVRDYFS